jgi:uncharacterized membrane protein
MWAADFVYLLCTITSLVCAALLLRSYARNRVPLLFWSAVCFIGLFVNNLMVLIDLDTIVFPSVFGLAVWRLVPAVIGLAALCYGLITEASR